MSQDDFEYDDLEPDYFEASDPDLDEEYFLPGLDDDDLCIRDQEWEDYCDGCRFEVSSSDCSVEIIPGVYSCIRPWHDGSYFCHITFPLALGRSVQDANSFLCEIIQSICLSDPRIAVPPFDISAGFPCLSVVEGSAISLRYSTECDNALDDWPIFTFLANSLCRSGIVAFTPSPGWVVEGYIEPGMGLVLRTPAFRAHPSHGEFSHITLQIANAVVQVTQSESLISRIDAQIKDIEQGLICDRRAISRLCSELEELQGGLRLSAQNEIWDVGALDLIHDRVVESDKLRARMRKSEARKKVLVRALAQRKERLIKARAVISELEDRLRKL